MWREQRCICLDRINVAKFDLTRLIMNKTVISLLIFALLLMFIFSPFAALTGLMLVLFVSVLFTFIVNILQVLVGSKQPNQNLTEGE